MTSTSPRTRLRALRWVAIVSGLRLAVTACSSGEDATDDAGQHGRTAAQTGAPSTPAGSLTRSAPEPSAVPLTQEQLRRLRAETLALSRAGGDRGVVLCDPEGREIDGGRGSCKAVLGRLGLGTPELLEAWRADRAAAGRTGQTFGDLSHPPRYGAEVLEGDYVLVVLLRERESWETQRRHFMPFIDELSALPAG